MPPHQNITVKSVQNLKQFSTFAPKKKKMAGIYIHVPFCASRCVYCAFYTTTTLSSQDRLVQALCSELEMRRDYLLDKAAPSLPITIGTIYLGGGTPRD